MKKSTRLNILASYLVPGLLSVCMPVIGQTSNLQISTSVGDPLPSTGIQQILPQISNIATVAPDVLCIEIDACRIIPCIQIPYSAESEDVITEGDKTALGETRNIYVVRNGFPLGTLVGNDRKTITLYERLVGDHLDTEAADRVSSYEISSTVDGNYGKGLKPEKVWRKSRPTGWTDSSWQLSRNQTYTAKNFLYLKLPFPLKTGQTYLISLPGLNVNRSSAYYVHDPVHIRSEAVHTSQIGFRSDDPDKNPFLSVWMGNGGGYTYPDDLEFWLINDRTNDKVFSGKAVMQWKGNEPEGIGTKVNHTGADLIRLDFSSFSTPGRYRVCVDGIGCGYPFNIDAESTWKHAFEIAMKGLLVLRNSISLGPP